RSRLQAARLRSGLPPPSPGPQRRRARGHLRARVRPSRDAVPASAPVPAGGAPDPIRQAVCRPQPWRGRQERAPHQRRAQSPPPDGRGGVSGLGPVLLAEALHATRRVDQLLLAREERMAGSADVQMDLVLGGSSLERIATRAPDGGGGISGMY